MGTLQAEWNHIQWQLDPYKWYLHNNQFSGLHRRHNGDHYKLLPQRYEKRYLLRVMRYLSNEGMLGLMIFLVICFTLYMHTYMLDTTRNFYLPTDTKIEYRQKVTVMLAIVVHSPPSYLENTLNSLNASQHEADIFVFRNFANDDVCENVSQWYPGAKVISDKGQNKTASIYRTVMDHFIFSKYDVLVYINSYSTVCAKWWDILMEGLDRTKGVFSLYGMERDMDEIEKWCDTLLCRQSWIGWIGSVWRRNLATRMVSETAKEKANFQYKMENWCKLKKIPIHVMRYSAIDISNNGRRVVSQPPANQLTPICIAAVARVRIYREDEAKLTAFEIEQWVRYMQYAGVDVVHLYDAFEQDDENLYAWVKGTFKPDEVIYHNWYYNRTYDILDSIRSAYRHGTRKYKYTCAWHIHADINEYPFLSNDTEKDFLKRLVVKIRSIKKNINEISLSIFQFTGKDTKDPLLVWRQQSRYQTRITGEARPLFLASSVKKTHLFHNKLLGGETIYIDPKVARINRYSLKFDNKSIVDKIIPDESVSPISRHLKQINFISNKLPLNVINQFWES